MQLAQSSSFPSRKSYQTPHSYDVILPAGDAELVERHDHGQVRLYL